jgi:cupin fold WbuC family metalloprotein
MPELIFSKQDESSLLLAINRADEITNERTDICPDNEYLQICTKQMSKGVTFKPHRHNKLIRTTDITQEAWIILQGSVAASFWDVNDKVIYETTLNAGDCAVVFKAGHGFTVLEEGTVLYEIKSGPYYGIEKDKTFIGENYEQ